METTETMQYIKAVDGRELVRVKPRPDICLVIHKRAVWRKQDSENILQEMLVV